MRRVNIATEARSPQIPVTGRAALSPTGEYAATFDNTGGVQFWQAETAQKLSKVATDISLKDPNSVLPQIAFTSTGSRVAIGDSKTVTVYDAVNGSVAGKPIPLIGILQNLDLSPDTSLVSTLLTPGLLTVWDAAKAFRTTLPMMDGSFLVQVKFSPDGRRLLTRAQNDARLWDVETGQTVSVIIAEEGMRDAAFSPDGRFVATAADEIHVHCIWIGGSDNSESNLLAEVAGAAGGYVLDANSQPVPLLFEDWIRRLAALRTLAAQAQPDQPTVASFLHRYFGQK
jgi:WD40 repeat protein